ncbi:hypothetical protein ACFW1A_17390 [Kitasatospora sp. NPDC058965]|uniref:hypothetical protein n=1 Tax=Kitasatospora sp. NPDC058965 TaxID=3346682 RepID=UPI0036BD9627
MRPSAFSGFAKKITTRRGLATAAAALVLGTALPVLGGGTPAWACGAPELDPSRTTPANTPGVNPLATPFEVPGSVTADGSWTVFNVETGNTTDHAYENAYPTLTFGDLPGHHLRAQDLQLEVMRGGQWHELSRFPGCAAFVSFDSTTLKTHLDAGHAFRTMFRFRLAPGSDPKLTELSVGTVAWADHATDLGNSNLTVLPVRHPAPAATPSAKPSIKPSAEPSAAAVAPAAATSAPGAPAPTGTAVPAAGPAELASTGGGDSSWTLVAAGSALVAFGTAAGLGAVFASRRRARRA